MPKVNYKNNALLNAIIDSIQSIKGNDVISLNGGTQGGDKFSYLEITALATAEYLVQGVLIGSGSLATPFADS